MGHDLSDETKQKISKSLQGEKNPMFGKKGSLNPLHGKTRSAETRQKISEKRKKAWKNKKDDGNYKFDMKHKPIIIKQEIIDKIQLQYNYLSMYPKKDNVVYIYMLTDPTNNNYIKYIGKSEDLKLRLNTHILDDYKYTYSKKTCWIVHLLSQDKVPTMHVLEICNLENWQERERYWIKFHLDANWDLCNGTEGGEGVSNPSEEVRKKKSESMTGEKHFNFGKHLKEETKEKISQSLIGHAVTQETREKLSLASSGENNSNINGLSESHKANISKAMTGNDSNNSKAQTLAWKNPDTRQARSEGIANSWIDKDIRDSRLEGLNDYWESEEGKQRKKSMAEDSERMQTLSEKAADAKRQKRLSSPKYWEEVEEVKNLYLQGTAAFEIRKILKRSGNYVTQRLKDSGIKLRTKSESSNNQYTKSSIISQ